MIKCFWFCGTLEDNLAYLAVVVSQSDSDSHQTSGLFNTVFFIFNVCNYLMVSFWNKIFFFLFFRAKVSFDRSIAFVGMFLTERHVQVLWEVSS